ncbi:hypothetical protein L1887_44460 [Cichorium endivia]|nr:hypothetical protein L1887_44460 [Cichorium endivia]
MPPSSQNPKRCSHFRCMELKKLEDIKPGKSRTQNSNLGSLPNRSEQVDSGTFSEVLGCLSIYSPQPHTQISRIICVFCFNSISPFPSAIFIA